MTPPDDRRRLPPPDPRYERARARLDAALTRFGPRAFLWLRMADLVADEFPERRPARADRTRDGTRQGRRR